MFVLIVFLSGRYIAVTYAEYIYSEDNFFRALVLQDNNLQVKKGKNSLNSDLDAELALFLVFVVLILKIHSAFIFSSTICVTALNLKIQI